MSLESQFVEEDHIQMGNLTDGDSYVHVYKMKFSTEAFESYAGSKFGALLEIWRKVLS